MLSIFHIPRLSILFLFLGLLGGAAITLLAFQTKVPGTVPGTGSEVVPGTVPGTTAARMEAYTKQNLIPIKNENPELLASAFQHKEAWSVALGTRLILVPHHLVAAKEIASLLSATPKPSIVYLLAPDHLSGGKTKFSTIDATFGSPTTGSTAANEMQSLIQEVNSTSGGLTISQSLRAFENEPASLGLIPYLSTAWPQAKLVPILVRLNAKDSEQNTLVYALADRLKNDPRALVVASIDFSHYLPAEVADFHDAMALDALKSLNGFATSSSEELLEIDSPPIFRIATSLAGTLGLGHVTIHAHTNSLRILKTTTQTESTSHFLASFSPGKIQASQTQSFLVLPTARLTYSPYFNILKGKEDRFFSGIYKILPWPDRAWALSSSAQSLVSPIVTDDLALGVVKGATSSDIYLFPLIQTPTGPRLAVLKERTAALETLAKRADPEIHEEVRQGLIHIVE